MRKELLLLIASSLPIAAMAGGDRDIEHGSVALRMEPAVSLEVRGRGAEDSDRSLRQVAMPRYVSGYFSETGTKGSVGAVAAPEIDPASAASGLTLLLGGMAVLRGRKVR